MCQALPGAGVTAENRVCDMKWELGETEGGDGNKGWLAIQKCDLPAFQMCVLNQQGFGPRPRNDRSSCHYGTICIHISCCMFQIWFRILFIQ